jgi:hypothetical protein
MGSGLAKSLRDKWPIVYDDYKKYCDKTIEIAKPRFGKVADLGNLGSVCFSKVGEDLYVVSMFAQYDYNRNGARNKQTEYFSFLQAIENFIGYYLKNRLPIYFPFNIGCDRGGADWDIISSIIEQV